MHSFAFTLNSAAHLLHFYDALPFTLELSERNYADGSEVTHLLYLKVWRGTFPANWKLNWEETSSFSDPGRGGDDAGGEGERGSEIRPAGKSSLLYAHFFVFFR